MPDPTNITGQQYGWRITVQSLHPDQMAAGHQSVFTVEPGSVPMVIQDALRSIADILDVVQDPIATDNASDAFKTLCAYARNYIEEYGNHAEADELERIIDSLSHRPAIPGTAAKADETLPAAPTAITTVAQLIKLLQSQPEDMRVVVDGYEGGYSDVKPQKLIQIPISLNVHPDDQWYYGNHDDPRGGMPAETVLLISRHEQ